MNTSPDQQPEFIVTQETFVKLSHVNRDAAQLCQLLQADFLLAWHRVTDSDFEEAECRGLVRSFASLLDGITTAMRSVAVVTCKSFNRPLNPFLQDKVEDRATNSYQRIYQSYRLIGEFLPGSPLSSISDRVWNELHEAIEIRNRVIHPKEARDMTLSTEDTLLVMRTGKEFHNLFNKFWIWLMEKQQKLISPYVVVYKRMFAKPERNKPCPCGSHLKYKDCCFRSTAVAA